jgi:hypothetical protein
VKSFTPSQILLSKDKEMEARMELHQQQKEVEKRRFFLRSTRHSKFGTQLGV